MAHLSCWVDDGNCEGLVRSVGASHGAIWDSKNVVPAINVAVDLVRSSVPHLILVLGASPWQRLKK
jgi:hypothetical protein